MSAVRLSVATVQVRSGCGGKYARLSRAVPARRIEAPAGTSTGMEPPVSTTVPPQERGRHGWAELLALVGDLRRLAYDRSLDE